MKLQFGRRDFSDFVCDVFQSTALSATKWLRSGVAALLIYCIVPFGVAGLYAQQAPPANTRYTQLDCAQLDQLLAPIALYPDSLVAQILAAATHPSRVVEADRFLERNSFLPSSELVRMVDEQPWDPSIKALTAFPFRAFEFRPKPGLHN